MCHVDAFWPQLTCHALSQSAQSMLGASKGGKSISPAQACGGTREDDGATASGQHGLGHFAAHQEATEAGHLPDLEVDTRGCFGDAIAHVGADIEHANLTSNLVQQRRELVFVTPRDASDVALSGKSTCDSTACGVSCADHKDCFLFCHVFSFS